MVALEDILACENVEQFDELMKKHQILYFWQKQSPSHVYTYNQTGNQFLDTYYSTEADLICPVAWAYRSRQWPIFTHDQARAEKQFNSINNSEQANEMWRDHGFIDGTLCLSGRPEFNSFAVFSSPKHIEDLAAIEVQHFAATRKLDMWLKDHQNLEVAARDFKFLSPKELDTLKLQITEPHLSLAEQAAKLSVTVPTLKTRQERITKKFGVKRFIGAALLAERTGFLE